MALFTPLPADNLNEAKDIFHRIPNKTDGSHLHASLVRQAISGATLSAKSERVALKRVDLRGDGVATFGELAPLLRGGSAGSLSAKDATLLSNALLVQAFAPNMAKLLENVSHKAILDTIRKVFDNEDSDKDGVILWGGLRSVAEHLGEDLNVPPQDVTAALARIPSTPPHPSQRELDFEDW